MIIYLIEVTTTWSVLYLIFFLFLRKETYFELNRWYLLSSIALGLSLPGLKLIAVDLFSAKDETITVAISQIQEIPYFLSQSITTTEVSWTVYLFMFFKVAYLLGASFFLARLIQGLLSIRNIYLQGTKTKHHAHTIVSSDQEHLPFSFFNYVFISNTTQLNSDYQDILNHELKHVKSRHTLDVLFLELVNIVLWFHPIVYLYKSALRQTHEYLADEAALTHSTKKVYGHILLKQSLSGIQIALANHFFHSHIKKRIDMMYQSKSTKKAWIKYSFAIPVIALFAILFVSQRDAIANSINHDNYVDTGCIEHEDKSINNPIVSINENGKGIKSKTAASKKLIPLTNNHFSISDTSKANPYGDEVFKVVEQLPFFSDCTTRDCSDQKLLAYVYENLDYPKQAIKNKTEGKVYLQFVINKKGNIQDERVLRDIGDGCGAAALDVLQKMRKLINPWRPGKQKEHSVNVLYTLPVVFNLKEVQEVKSPESDLRPASTLRDTIPTTKKDKKAYFSLATHDSKNKGLVSTRDGNGIEPMYILNGKEIQPEESKLIDHQNIESISVLKNKKAKRKYPESGDRGVVVIKTKDSHEVENENKLQVRNYELGSSNKKEQFNPTYLLDGEVISETELEAVDVNTIASVNVYKDESAKEKYPEHHITGVVEVITKGYSEKMKVELEDPIPSKILNGNASTISLKNTDKDLPLFVVDGIKLKGEIDHDLSPDDILSINVLRGENAEAKYPGEALNGVIEIITKEGAKSKIITLRPVPSPEEANLIQDLKENGTYPEAKTDVDEYQINGKVVSKAEYKEAMSNDFLFLESEGKDGKSSLNLVTELPVEKISSFDNNSSAGEIGLKIISSHNGNISFSYDSKIHGNPTAFLFNSSGQILKRQNLNKEVQSIEVNMEVHSLNSGIYFLSVFELGSRKTVKFNYQQ